MSTEVDSISTVVEGIGKSDRALFLASCFVIPGTYDMMSSALFKKKKKKAPMTGA
jgi:hypothetical protein